MVLSAAAIALCAGPVMADGKDGAKKPRAKIVKKVSSGGHSGISVPIDYSKLMQLKGSPTTAVIGNPAIADIQLLEGGVLFVQGRGYGTTNLIVLDGAGKTVLNTVVTVVPPESNTVAVYRGSSVNNYSCGPRCVRAPMPGENQDAYTGAAASYDAYMSRSMNPSK